MVNRLDRVARRDLVFRGRPRGRLKIQDPSENIRPEIVCLVGSTKFKAVYEAAARQFTEAGAIVLSAGFFHHADNIELTEAEGKMLDDLYLWKVALADVVFCLNVGGYIGKSTQAMLDFAEGLGRAPIYLEA